MASYATGGFTGFNVSTVKISDLLEVYPELRKDGESHSELARKISRAAEWNRGLDADTDLTSRLHPDTIENDNTVEGE